MAHLQAMLAEITNKNNSSSCATLTMPDWEAERDTLFREKYPCPTKSEGVSEGKMRRAAKKPQQGRVSVNDSDEVERRRRRRRTQPKRCLPAGHNHSLAISFQ